MASRYAGFAAAALLNVFVSGIVVQASATIPHAARAPDIPQCDCVYIAMATVPAFPEIRDWNSLAITLNRGPCFGTCPIYTVTIHGDGRIEYEGAQFTAHPGKYEAKISVAQVRALFEKFRAANFFALRVEYRGEVTDNPTYTVTLRYDDHEKRVVDYVGRMVAMPLVVTELERAIDEAADTARWVAREPAQ